MECASRAEPKATCDEYWACQDALDESDAQRTVRTALATGEGLDDAWTTCEVLDFEEEAMVRACHDVRVRLIERETREVTELRDHGGNAMTACVALEAHAAKFSAQEKLRARALCKEANASRIAEEALDEARTNLAKGTLEVPFQCTMAVDDLAPLPSDWAKRRLREVLHGCYVELGKQILPAHVPDMLICEYQAEQVYIAVKTFGLKDPELDPWIARANKKCAKSLRRKGK